VRFHPEVPLISLLRLVHLRSRLPEPFFVELGAEIKVASTAEPAFSIRLDGVKQHGRRVASQDDVTPG
jgi:hypothetical protein